MENQIATAIIKEYERQARPEPVIDIAVKIGNVEYWIWCEFLEDSSYMGLYNMSCTKSGCEVFVNWPLIEEMVLEEVKELRLAL